MPRGVCGNGEWAGGPAEGERPMAASLLKDWLSNYLPSAAPYLAVALLITATLISGVLAYVIARWVIVRLIHYFIRASRTRWDDALMKAHFFSTTAHIAPAAVVHYSGKILFADAGQQSIQQVGLTYMVLVGTLACDAFIRAAASIYGTLEASRTNPIKGFVQGVRVFIYAIGIALLLSIFLDRTIWGLVGGIGAVTAVVLLVFRDSILGLVASLNIVVNDLVDIGDWIEMPKFGADGDVVDITLTTVKVQNFDKTITNIPTYALTSESFKNWRGMKVTGGRRIKRAIAIDTKTIKFLTQEMFDRLSRSKLLGEYLDRKQKEVGQHREEDEGNAPDTIDARRLTNIGTFRAYVESYLERHPKLRNDMTWLVRQLPVTETGLPIEIYAFSSETEWREYERIQADIFDHLLAVLSKFELRVFQNPTSYESIAPDSKRSNDKKRPRRAKKTPQKVED